MPASIPVTKLQICQTALQLMGLAAVQNLSDSNDRASVCNLHYPMLMRSLLSKYNWDFGTKQVQLAIDATATPIMQHTFAYSLPPDRLYDDPLLVVLSADVGAPPFKRYVVQDEHLHTDQPTIFIAYTSQDAEDSKKWPDYFTELMEYALAARIGMALTEREDLVLRYEIKAWGRDLDVPGGLYAAARRRNFQNKPPKIFQDFELILARLGGL